MKKLLLLILTILMIPMVVHANQCNPDDIEIMSIELDSVLGNAKEASASTIDNKKLNLDVKLYDPNDAIEYKVTIKNNSDEEYYIKENDLLGDEHLDYSVSFDDDNYKIDPNSEKEIVFKISYKDRVVDTFSTTNNLSIDVLDRQSINASNTLKNLSIGLIILIVVVTIIIAVGMLMLFINYKRARKVLILLVASFIFIPISTSANCKCTINIEVKVSLDNKEAIFDTGEKVNLLMKTLAGTTIEHQDNISDAAVTIDTNILAFKKSSVEPTDENKNIASTADSPFPIYIWFDNGIIYWWSEDDTPALNEDSGFMFVYLTKLSNVEGIASFDTSNVKYLYCLFAMDSELLSIEPLANWNTSNISDLSDVFYGNLKVTDFTPISNWNVSNVEDLGGTFGKTSISNLNFLSKWKLPKLVNLQATFYYNDNLTDISVLSSWDTSKVTCMYTTFLNDPNLSDFTPIANWDVSNVEEMDYMFSNTGITNVDFLEKWDVSNVISMSGLFEANSKLTNLDGISSWQTSSLVYMSAFCYECRALTSVAGIEHWDVSNVKYFGSLLSYSEKVKTIDFSSWDTSSAVYMSSMFNDMYSLESINLSGWNTSKVTSMSYMFNTLSRMKVLDISSFDTRNVTSFKRMFNASHNLEHIYIGENWDTSKNEDEVIYVFHTTTKLPNFDTTDPEYRYLKYAKPTTEGGYLELKTNENP